MVNVRGKLSQGELCVAEILGVGKLSGGNVQMIPVQNYNSTCSDYEISPSSTQRHACRVADRFEILADYTIIAAN